MPTVIFLVVSPVLLTSTQSGAFVVTFDNQLVRIAASATAERCLRFDAASSRRLL